MNIYVVSAVLGFMLMGVGLIVFEYMLECGIFNATLSASEQHRLDQIATVFFGIGAVLFGIGVMGIGTR